MEAATVAQGKSDPTREGACAEKPREIRKTRRESRYGNDWGGVNGAGGGSSDEARGGVFAKLGRPSDTRRGEGTSS